MVNTIAITAPTLKHQDIGYRIKIFDYPTYKYSVPTGLITSWFCDYIGLGDGHKIHGTLAGAKRSAARKNLLRYEVWKLHIGDSSSSLLYFLPEIVFFKYV
jgi:hypothetical protein